MAVSDCPEQVGTIDQLSLDEQHSEMLNRQQAEVHKLTSTHAPRLKQARNDAEAAASIALADAELELKDRHYDEVTTSIREYELNDETSGADSRQNADEHLELTKARLEEESRQRELELTEEREKFEKEQQIQLQSEVGAQNPFTRNLIGHLVETGATPY